ncbi:hypothetical protein WA158_006575 [Blastocystis sp. Blastoise]
MLFIKLILLCFVVSINAEKWAVIMGTSSGWSDYSVTSNPCRAYDLLIDSGMDPERIIYLSYSKNIDYDLNPFPGKLFTDPSESEGKDWASKCKDHIDYTEDQISPEIVLSILQGNKQNVMKLLHTNSAKVLESTENDTVFFYYMDHGIEGAIIVGGRVIRESELMNTFNIMYTKKMYKEMVVFMEACHSGSMFVNMPSDMNIYVLSSSDSSHNADMSNCPPYDKVNGKSLKTCLSGLYDNIWQSYIENSESQKVTFSELFEYTSKTVKESGSNQNVCQFGSVEQFKDYTIDQFIGNKKIIKKNTMNITRTHENTVSYVDVPKHVALWNTIRSSKDTLEENMKQLESVLLREMKEEITLMRFARSLISDDIQLEQMKRKDVNIYNKECVLEFSQHLIEQCHYTTPFKYEYNNIIHNICSIHSLNSISFESLCI